MSALAWTVGALVIAVLGTALAASEAERRRERTWRRHLQKQLEAHNTLNPEARLLAGAIEGPKSKRFHLIPGGK